MGWKYRPEDYEVARLLLRARASNTTPPGCAKIWFNMYGSTHGPGKATFITFAVWDGSAGDVGARKVLSYSWITLKVE